MDRSSSDRAPPWLGPAVALAAIVTPVVNFLKSSPFPLGVFPAALLGAYLLYLGVRYFESWAGRGATGGGGPKPAPWSEAPTGPDGTPLAPVTSPVGIAGLASRAPTPRWPAPGSSPGVTVVPNPTRAQERTGTPRAAARLWTAGGEASFEGGWKRETVSIVPPTGGLFGRNLMIAFGVIALALLAFHTYIFFALDRIVAGAGRIVYWPLDWPGLIQDPGLRRQLPDYIFLLYLAVMLAFTFASGLFTNPRFARTQRRDALLILGAYLLTEVTVDIFFFSVSDRFTNSSFLLMRGAIGGLYFSLLIFSLLALPPALNLKRVLPRDRPAITEFLAVVAISLVIAVAILFAMFRFVGIGRELVPFAVLLLAPLLALTIWGFIGRILYDIQLASRPLPSLDTYHPSVTIIIPAYNEGENIRGAVESADAACALYPGSVEILVSNDGSTDATSEVARAAIARLQHATGGVVDLPHGGKSNALNGGLAVARGEIIVRLDGDTRLSAARGFGALVRHFADPEVGAVQGLILPLQQDGWTRKLRFLEIAWNHLFLRRGMMVMRCAQVVDGSFCAFRRQDMLALGGWVAWNGEDTEVTLRLQRLGYRTRFETQAAAFEDVPADLDRLRSQRIRWNRGGIIAHRRHLTGLFGDAFEYGGLAILFWFTLFVRGGVRSLIWVYAAFATAFLGLPTLLHVAVIAGFLLVPRGIVLGYYLVKFHRWQWLPYISIWPVTGTMKQYFTMESFGTLLPGSAAEYAE